MAALGPVRRLLLYGIIFGALTFAATPSGASVVASPAPAATVVALLYGDERGGAEAVLQEVHWDRFCRWYSHHRLCFKLVKLRRFCDRRPHHRLCDDDDDDRFCRRRPDHPLCNDDQPPSPS